MASFELVKLGLECCQSRAGCHGVHKRCNECPYGIGLCLEDELHREALELLIEYRKQLALLNREKKDE